MGAFKRGASNLFKKKISLNLDFLVWVLYNDLDQFSCQVLLALTSG